MTNLTGINRKSKQYVKYPEDPSAIKPVPYGPGIPNPKHPDETFLTQDSEDELHDVAVDDDADGSPIYMKALHIQGKRALPVSGGVL
ncbi:UNVERIFIED_CONTAM: hypothetical protein RMT77_001380 [Armadillidium vulgare]